MHLTRLKRFPRCVNVYLPDLVRAYLRASSVLNTVCTILTSRASRPVAYPPMRPRAQAPYPSVAVRPCSAKQRHALPPEVRYTCASAFPLAAAAAAAAAAARVAAARAAAAAVTAAAGSAGLEAGAAQALGTAPVADSASQPSGRLPKKLRKQQGQGQGQGKGQGQGQGQGAATVSAPAVAQVLASRFNSTLQEAAAAGAVGTSDALVGGLVSSGCAKTAAAVDAAGMGGSGEGAAQQLLWLLAAARLGQGVEARAVPSGHINFHIVGSDAGVCSQRATATAEAAAAAGRARQGHTRVSGCGSGAGAKEERGGTGPWSGSGTGAGAGSEASCGAPGGRPCKRRQLGCGASSQDGTKGVVTGMGALDGKGGAEGNAVAVEAKGQASPSARGMGASGRSGSGTGPGLGPRPSAVGWGGGTSTAASALGLGPDQLWVQREGEEEEQVGASGRQQQQQDGHAGTREDGAGSDGGSGGDGSNGGVGRRRGRRLEVRLVRSAFIEEEFELYKR